MHSQGGIDEAAKEFQGGFNIEDEIKKEKGESIEDAIKKEHRFDIDKDSGE